MRKTIWSIITLAIAVSITPESAPAQTYECAYSETNQHLVVGDFSACTGADAALYGENASAAGAGVVASGNLYGVYSTASAVNGTALWGESTSTTGYGVGVKGFTLGSTGTAIVGRAMATSGANIGVLARTDSSDGIALKAWNYGDDVNGLAAVLSGKVLITSDLQVYGNLSKGGGSFKIDHPQEPKVKYLSHSFVESPDMMNIYNDNVQLDAEGKATVSMPGYFETLNKEFRYQLTPVGGGAPNLHVATEIDKGTFRIAGGAPGMKVSWQVTGVRNDAYAQKNRIVVEEYKATADRGKYLHPEAFGEPKERGIAYVTTGADAPRLAAAGK